MSQPESDPPPLSRIELLRLAQSLGVSDADVMTRAELRAAIEKARAPAPPSSEHPKTWVGVARRLLASVIERGLNLPDAAALIRGDTKLSTPPKAPPPVATVTLARIYAAQGHLERAIGTLDEVLLSDPDHELARDLRAQLELRRQELVARDADADAVQSVRPPEDELTPIMPEVALRETAGERRASPALGSEAGESLPPNVPAPAASEPGPASSAVATELFAPAFAAPDRAEAPSSLTAEPPAQGEVSHDSETPPAPSAFAFEEPEPELSAARAPSFGLGVTGELGAGRENDTLRVGGAALGASDEVLGARGDTLRTEGTSIGAAPAEASDELASEPPPRAFNAAEELEVRAVSDTLVPSHDLPPHAGSGAPDALGDGPPPANGLGVSRHEAANGVADAAAVDGDGAPDAPPAVRPEVDVEVPHAPGLVLIEAEPRQRPGGNQLWGYLYWELGPASSGSCWLHVVSHTPTAEGPAERRERRFPVQQRCGVLRLEGVPARAIVRAKLSQDPDGRPVAVAGSVRSHDAALEVCFSPRPHAPIEALARRASPLLARATPVYWDR